MDDNNKKIFDFCNKVFSKQELIKILSYNFYEEWNKMKKQIKK